MTAQERERSRVSSELDAGLNQDLGVIALELADAERALPAEADEARRGVEDLHARLAELSSEIYRISRRLHPALLDDVGLVGAIEAECEALRSTSGIAVDTRLDPALDQLPPDVRLCFYRVVQESLHNLARHARVERGTVELVDRDGVAELAIEDAGVGFDPDQLVPGAGLGLSSMSERLRILGGQLTVTSRPGAGTRIQARISRRTARTARGA